MNIAKVEIMGLESSIKASKYPMAVNTDDRTDNLRNFILRRKRSVEIILDRAVAVILQAERRESMTLITALPFCRGFAGEAAECDIKQSFANGWVGCQRCRCFMDFVKNGKPLAIAAWNRRAELRLWCVGSGQQTLTTQTRLFVVYADGENPYGGQIKAQTTAPTVGARWRRLKMKINKITYQHRKRFSKAIYECEGLRA